MSRQMRIAAVTMSLVVVLGSATVSQAGEPPRTDPKPPSSVALDLSDFSLEHLLGLSPLRNAPSLPDGEGAAAPAPKQARSHRTAHRNAPAPKARWTSLSARSETKAPRAHPPAAAVQEQASTRPAASVTAATLREEEPTVRNAGARTIAPPPLNQTTTATITYDAANGIQTTSLSDGTTFVDLYDPKAFLRAPIRVD